MIFKLVQMVFDVHVHLALWKDLMKFCGMLSSINQDYQSQILAYSLH